MKKIFKILATYSLCLSTIFSVGCNNNSTGDGQSASGSGQDSSLSELLTQKYEITTSSKGGGAVSANTNEAQFGDTVTFTFTADEGYVLAVARINGNEIELEGDSYSIPGAMRDYKVEAEFVEADVTVSFVGENVEGVGNISVAYGQKIGELPTPRIPVGKQFIGWKNEAGEMVGEDTLALTETGEIVLTAVWGLVNVDTALYQPFSISTAYHDASATNYGVVWHTRTAPANSVVLVSEGESVNEESARVIAASSELWFKNEYISQAVVDELKFNTTYTVKFGDASAGVWSREYTFTTREEVVESTEFFYISDTQETYKIEDMGDWGNNIAGGLNDTYVSQVMREATMRFPDADFIAHGGDIVNWGAESIGWEQMLGSLDEYLFSLPMMAVAGNHEDPMHYGFGREVPHIVDKMFNIDGVYDEHASSGIYYSFDYGPLHFVGLRSNDVFNDYGAGYISEKQLAWLVNDVTEAQKTGKWVVAMMHEGPLNVEFTGSANSNTHTGTLSVQLMPIFDELGVDLLLYAHNHWLVTTYPLVWDETAEPMKNTQATVRPSTTAVNSVLHDGVSVNEFVFAEGIANRGTVYHHAATAGPQMHTKFLAEEAAALKAEHKIYYALGTNGIGALAPETGAATGKAYPSYSYIEVSGDSLVVRTYGVDVGSVVKEQDDEELTKHGVYIDGFKLSK